MPYWSPSHGFQTRATHGAGIPPEAVRIKPSRHRDLVAAQAAGAEIYAGKGGRPYIRRPRENLEHRRAFVRQCVKREARRRILAIAPEWRQANDNAALAMAALQLSATMTTGVDTSGPISRRAAIDALRAVSDQVEQRLEAMNGAELEAFDPSADLHWSPRDES
jgi:hypothetical protein